MCADLNMKGYNYESHNADEILWVLDQVNLVDLREERTRHRPVLCYLLWHSGKLVLICHNKRTVWRQVAGVNVCQKRSDVSFISLTLLQCLLCV